MTIEQLFIILLASFGLLEFIVLVWQDKHVRRLTCDLRMADENIQQAKHGRCCHMTCKDCGGEMIDEWFCPICEGAI